MKLDSKILLGTSMRFPFCFSSYSFTALQHRNIFCNKLEYSLLYSYFINSRILAIFSLMSNWSSEIRFLNTCRSNFFSLVVFSFARSTKQICIGIDVIQILILNQKLDLNHNRLPWSNSSNGCSCGVLFTSTYKLYLN